MSRDSRSSDSVLTPGVTCDDTGAAFVLFSAHAEAVELCLFNGSGEQEIARVPLQREGDLWHCRVTDLHAGQRYGYRAYGRYDPPSGHRFNPKKLLIDPYARLLDGPIRLHPAHFGYSQADPAVPDVRDSAAFTPKCVLVRETPPVSFAGVSSAIASYVVELIDPAAEPYTPTIRWIERNVPAGSSIRTRSSLLPIPNRTEDQDQVAGQEGDDDRYRQRETDEDAD